MRRALLITAVVLLAPASAARAETIEARGDPYSALDDAILEAEPNDTIVLGPREYLLTEGQELEEKDLTLRGAGEERTTVIPAGGGEAFEDEGVSTVGVGVGIPLQPPAGDRDNAEGSGDSGGISGQAQAIAVIVTLGLFLFVLELVRRRRLVERYALLWMLAALALLVLAIWTELLDGIAEAMGIEEPANAIFILAFGVAFLLLLNFSVVSSRLGEETKILAQEVARLDEDLRAQQAQDEAPVTRE